MRLIPNAVDTTVFVPDATRERGGVLCVATISRNSIAVKSLELFRQAAIADRRIHYTLVGPAIDGAAQEFVNTLPDNVSWIGPLAGDKLVEAYQRASAFFLPSRIESFSLALAEAASCGCIPVISSRGALPEVGGPDAIVLKDLDVATCVAAIQSALRAPDDQRHRLREHIRTHFDTTRRKAELIRLMTELIQQ